MEEHKYIIFSKAGRDNTDEVFNVVNTYLEKNRIDKIIISSTTGYTAYRAECILNFTEEVIICKQDISEEYSMKPEVIEDLKKRFRIFDIPPKYLQNIIGTAGTNILRKISQGFKVCIELAEYLMEKDKMAENEKIIIVAGTLKGADTAIVFETFSNRKYSVDKILCLPKVK